MLGKPTHFSLGSSSPPGPDQCRSPGVRNGKSAKVKRTSRRTRLSNVERYSYSPEYYSTSFNPPPPGSPFVFGFVATPPPSVTSADTTPPASPIPERTGEFGDNVADKENGTASSSKMGVSISADATKELPKEEEDLKQPLSHTNLQLALASRFLKGIPQNPHFYQLRNYSESVRRNLMSGWDRIFEETVEALHNLQAKDFWVRAKELWKTMEELESLGYNMILLRKRLVELSDVMMEEKCCKCKILGLKNRAEYHRMEKSRLEFEILKLQGEVERKEESVVGMLKMVVEMEKELPEFNGVFSKLALKPLVEESSNAVL